MKLLVLISILIFEFFLVFYALALILVLNDLSLAKTLPSTFDHLGHLANLNFF